QPWSWDRGLPARPLPAGRRRFQRRIFLDVSECAPASVVATWTKAANSIKTRDRSAVAAGQRRPFTPLISKAHDLSTPAWKVHRGSKTAASDPQPHAAAGPGRLR